jgi:hypothetical protein
VSKSVGGERASSDSDGDVNAGRAASSRTFTPFDHSSLFRSVSMRTSFVFIALVAKALTCRESAGLGLAIRKWPPPQARQPPARRAAAHGGRATTAVHSAAAHARQWVRSSCLHSSRRRLRPLPPTRAGSRLPLCCVCWAPWTYRLHCPRRALLESAAIQRLPQVDGVLALHQLVRPPLLALGAHNDRSPRRERCVRLRARARTGARARLVKKRLSRTQPVRLNRYDFAMKVVSAYLLVRATPRARSRLAGLPSCRSAPADACLLSGGARGQGVALCG